MPTREATRSAAAESTRALLTALWEKNLPLLRERLQELEAAANAAAAGNLTAQQRAEAGTTAHKLAGSLGMFGYPRGTELARELEEALEGQQPAPAAKLTRKIGALRTHLKL